MIRPLRGPQTKTLQQPRSHAAWWNLAARPEGGRNRDAPMTYRQGLLPGVLTTALAAGAVGAGWWLYAAPAKEATKPATPGIPATVPKPFKEDQAATVVLTPEAEAKLAVKLAKVERKSVPRARVFGGEVVVPPGKS